jgi:cyclomaltodextrinase
VAAAIAVVSLTGAGSCTEPEGAPSSSSEPRIELTTRGGDVFSWSETVAGRTDCPDVSLEVNGEPLRRRPTISGSTFEGFVPIASGPNEVVARCADDEGSGAVSAPVVFQGRLQERPTARIAVSVRGETVTLDGRGSRPTEPDGSNVTEYTWRLDRRHPAALTTADGAPFTRQTGRRLTLRAPSEDGEYYVTLEVSDAEGRSDASTTYFVVEDGRPRAVDMAREHPSWIDRAVIYAPIPDLWGKGGPKTVERWLPYLKDLGVDALWLWPPAEERAFGEEYAITDYFKLDPSWGPEPAFKHMVDTAHDLGLHVLVDFVPNHMSNQSPYFKDAKKHGEASHYWDFFDRRPDGRPTHYFDWNHLPNLNYDNPQVRNMVIEAMSHWVRDLGVDGFRVDAAWGVRRRRPGFWSPWRKELKRINPDLLLIAEAPAVHSYYFSHGFDVAYDWSGQPGQWMWTSAFEFPEESGALLSPALANRGNGYAPDAVVMRFLNNNDTSVRFVDQYGPEMTRVAATLQFTVPGIPEMFAGDEIGASYQPYSVLTRIPWRDRFNLSPLYRRLIRLKHEVGALASSDIELLATNLNSMLAYVRPAVEDSGPVLVLLNFGGKGRLQLEASRALSEAVSATGGVMWDLLTGEQVRLHVRDASVSLPMGAQSAFVLARDIES